MPIGPFSLPPPRPAHDRHHSSSHRGQTDFAPDRRRPIRARALPTV